ncbi:MAG: ABC transporter permease, partial [Lachnospiraceae bacterium]|nr:ABC transporter permease [Lachnospiraceae bacterium]
MLILMDAVSMIIFMSCLNLSLSCVEEIRDIKERTESEGIEIYCSVLRTSAGYPITPQDIRDYPTIAEKLFYFPYRDSISLDNDGNEYYYQCCFLSDAVFEQLLGMEREAGAVYIGRGAYDTLRRLKERAMLQNEDDDYLYYHFEGDAAYIGKELVADLSQIIILDEEQTDISLNSQGQYKIGEQIKLSDCLILPPEMIEEMDYETHAMPYKRVITIYQGERDDGGISDLIGFIRFLSERHPELQYDISDRILDLENSARDLMIPYRRLLLAAISMLLIIMTGMIGIFILILHRRKKEQAVSLAYGATKGQIFLEIFLEVFLCFAVGGLLAGMAAWYVTPQLTIGYLDLTGAWHGFTVWCAVGITLAE